MKLNRQTIQRMIDTGSVNVGGRRTGGGGGAGGGGGVSQSWVDENYVSKEFFARLFTIHGHDAEDQNDPPTDIVVEPNDADTPIDSIEAMFGVWTEQFLTALGVGSGGSGGGGGASALYDLVDVIPNSYVEPSMVYGLTGDRQADNGKVLTFSGEEGGWIAAEPQGTGTIQEITVTTPLGMLVNGSSSATITGSDTFAFTLQTGYYFLTTHYRNIIENIEWATWWGQRMVGDHITGAMSQVTNIDSLLYFDTTNKNAYLSVGNGCQFTFDSNSSNHSILKLQNYGETGETVAMLLNGTELLINNNATKNLALYAAQTMLFDTGAIERMRIDSSGNVGIGTSNPAYTLDVNGYTKTNRLYLSANVYLEYDSKNSGIHVVGAGLYADTFLSALGVGSGGGGVSLEQPLSGINSAGLGAPPSGQQKLLLWNGSAWTYGSPSSGGVGTVTSITAGTGLAGGIITSSGTISIDSTYQTYISHGETAYQNLSNYVQASAIKTLTIQADNSNAVIYTPNNSDALLNLKSGEGILLDKLGNEITFVLNDSGVDKGTYTKVVVDVYGRVTKGYNPTTLREYNITDAATGLVVGTGTNVNKIGVQTRGGQTGFIIVPYATAASKLNTIDTYTAWGQTFWINGLPLSLSGNMSGVGNISIRGNARISQDVSGGTVYQRSLYIGRIDNSGYVFLQDMASQLYKENGESYWTISQVGSAYFKETVTVGNLASNGYVTALSQSSSSDERMKNIIEHFALSVEDIAEAPIVKFTWKFGEDKAVHAGSIAQYWQKVLPESVLDVDGFLTLEYGVLALLSVISLAREVVNLKQRVARIEKKLFN